MKRKPRDLIKDLILYIVISAVIIAVPLTAFFLGTPMEPFMKWFGFVTFTALIFGISLEHSRQHWKKKSFQIMMTLLLIAHCAVLVAFRNHIDTHVARASVLVPIAMCEVLFLRVCTNILFHAARKRSNTGPSLY